jgi:phosphoserine phosphatase
MRDRAFPRHRLPMDRNVLRRPVRAAGDGHLRVVPHRTAPLTAPSPCAPPAVATLTVTGPNRPGVVEELFGALAQHAGTAPALELVDVGQVVMHGQLVLVVGVRTVEDAGPRGEDALLGRLVRSAVDVSAATGARVQVEAAGPARQAPAEHRRCRVTVVGGPVPLEAIAAVTQAMTASGGVVEAMWRLPGEPLTGLELVVTGAEPIGLCAGLAAVAAATGTDIAVAQADDVRPGW